jgi:hypothetical protein
MAPARWRNFVHQPRAFIARASIAPAKNWRNPTDPTGASALARPSTIPPRAAFRFLTLTAATQAPEGT